MKEDFVTYELAVKLKDKGFKEKCYAYYYPKGSGLIFNQNQFRGGIVEDCLYSNNSLPNECMASDFVDAPTISQVLKWLREEKKLYIEIWWLTQHTIKNLKGFQFVVTPICENPQRETDLELYCDYETAAIKGIEYVIDNWI